jgi:glycosyltransferase involved in cell wall biosynthesis
VPSVRYRGLMPLLHLSEARDIPYQFVYPSYKLRPLFNFITTYLEALFFRKRDSIIVFQKMHTSGIYARLLKYLLKKQPRYTIYDIDDAEYTRRPVATIHHFMQHCSCITVGSVALQQYAFAFNKNVFLLTSPVHLHTHIKQQRNAVFTIGWIGYFGAHNDSFEQYIYPIITSIPFPVRLMILGITEQVQREKLMQQFQSQKHIEVVAPENIDWLNEDVIYNYIENFDIGIAPLTDTEFNRAKSAYKMKQYLSCGVPVLASPVGENNTFMQDGVQGFICNEAGDFLKYIIHIHNMKEEEYTAMCGAALQQVQYFSMQTYCDGLISLAAQLNL